MRNTALIVTTLARLSRFFVATATILFTALAVEWWVAPEMAAARMGFEAVRPGGVVAMRAELGGLFTALAVLCGTALWTRGRAWTLAAMASIVAIVFGRSIGWTINGGPAGDSVDLAIELALIAALALGLRRPVTEESRTDSSRPAGARTHLRPATVATAFLVVAAATVSATFLSPSVQQSIFERGAQLNATTHAAPLVDDALRVAICGSSAPLPSAARAKSCVAVFAGGKFYIVDVGPESVENLVLWRIPLSKVGGVLLTHFHSDHIGDLGELNLQTWAGGRPTPLPVYGGPGVDQVVDGFNRAYRLDQGYRTAHHTAQVMPPSTWAMEPRTVELNGPPTTAKDRTGLVLDDGALTITAIEVDHAPIAPAYAYRFDYKGRSVLVTGDLKYHPALTKSAMGVDLMVSEAISVTMTRLIGKGATENGRSGTAAIMHDIEDYHITPEQAASIANNANVKLLAFYHLLPAPDGPLPRRLFAQGINEARRGDWTIADDGSLYTLPPNSSDVRIGTMTGGE